MTKLPEIWKSNELYKHLLEEEKAKKPRIPVKTHIPTLDSYIGEFTPGEVTILSGKTSMGKTTLAISFTASMCEYGNNVLWFSYEMGPLEFLQKTMDAQGNIPGFFLPFQLIPNDLKYIDFKIRECKKEFGLDVCFIDHLHYLCDLKNPSMSLEIGRVMRWLKQKAIEYQIVIFLICHVQKLLRLDFKHFDNDVLRDSSLSAQEADNVIFIARDSKIDNKACLKITKNRRHGFRNKYIYLQKKGNYLFEWEDRYEEDR
jgi:replicative DNA helicase